MSKLLAWLRDAARSGVYRASRPDAVLEATAGSGLKVARIALAGAQDKAALLERIARALEFPSWFGGNWDALEDCLADLSWTRAEGHVLLFEGKAGAPADDLAVLTDILGSVAASWAERRRPFFAVFVDGDPTLPPLYREKGR